MATTSAPININGKRKRGHVIRRAAASAPQLLEPPKSLLLLRGPKPGPYGLQLLTQLKLLKKSSLLLSRKNELFPFDDDSTINFLSTKNLCALFAFVSHSKKRPRNLVLGRSYNGQVLDMAEFGMEEFKTIQEVRAESKIKEGNVKAADSESVVIFQGDWNVNDGNDEILKNLLADIFRSRNIEEVDILALDHLITITKVGKKVLFRSYVVNYVKATKKNVASETDPIQKALNASANGFELPEVDLVEMGPRLDLTLRRTKFADDSLRAEAMKQPRAGKGNVRDVSAKKGKNVARDQMESEVVKVHMNTKDKMFYHSKRQKNKLGIK